MPALTEVLRDLAARRIQLVEVETATPSPFGRSLLFRYVGAFMYEGDAPLAERRAQALALDPALLAELLGTEALRELLDPAVVTETEADLQHLSAGRRCRDAEAVADLLRTSGPLTGEEVAARCVTPELAGEWLASLASARRIIEVRVAGQPMWAAIEDAGRLRDALGVALPVGIPEAFTEPLPDPLGDLVARWARTHGPFTAADVASRYGLGVAVVAMTLRRLGADGRVAEGEFLTTQHGTQWCDSEVLRMLRRRSLARLRKEVEPVPAAVLGRFLPAWHGIEESGGPDAGDGRGRGRRRRPGGGGWRRRADAGSVLEAIERLAGAPVPAAALETLVLPGRVPGYSPALLDELTSAGEVVWAGAGHGRHRGRLAGAGARRVRAAAAARAGRADHDAAARGGADRARGRRRAVLPDARRPGGAGARRPPGGRRRPGGGGVGPGLGGAADQRHAGAAAGAHVRRRGRTAAGRAPADDIGRRSARPGAASATPTGPGCSTPGRLGGRTGGYGGGRSAATAAGPGGRRCRRGPGRPRSAAAGRCCPIGTASPPPPLPASAATARRHPAFSAARRRRPCGRTRSRSPCSSGTACSPGAPSRPSGCRAGSRRSTRCCGRWRRPASAAAATSSRASARPSSRCRARSTGCGRWRATWSRAAPPTRADHGTRDGRGTTAGRGRVPGRARDTAPGRDGRGNGGGAADSDRRGRTVVLAAADPAQPYGAALPWPSRPEETATSHRPGRKAGAVVVLFAGELALYVERGGKTLLSWTDDPAVLAPCAHALAAAVRDGALGRMTVEKADGGAVQDSPLAAALSAAGFRATPRGLRLRG